MVGLLFSSQSFAIGFCSQVMVEKPWNKPLTTEQKQLIESRVSKEVLDQLGSHLEQLNFIMNEYQISPNYLAYARFHNAKEVNSSKQVKVLQVGDQYFYFAKDHIPGLVTTKGDFFGELKSGPFKFTSPVSLAFNVEGRGKLVVTPKGVLDLLNKDKMDAQKFLAEISDYVLGNFQRDFLEKHQQNLIELYQKSNMGVQSNILQSLRKAVFTKTGEVVYMIDAQKTKWILHDSVAISLTGENFSRLDSVDFRTHGDLIVIGEAKTYSLEQGLGFGSTSKLKDYELPMGVYLQALKISLEKSFGRTIESKELNQIVQPFARQYPGGFVSVVQTSLLAHKNLKPFYDQLSKTFSKEELEILFSEGYASFIPPAYFLPKSN